MGVLDSIFGGGGSTTTVDQNNPYSNALATNTEAMWKLLSPIILSGMQGQATPYGAQTNATNEQISRHYAGRYGIPSGSPGLQTSFERNAESLTKPTQDWSKLLQGIYGAGQPGPGGTTTTTQQQLGATDYLQLAAIVAAFACWVAREVYGSNDIRWVIFANWLHLRAPRWFRNLYINHGEGFAKFISNKPIMKRMVKFLMDFVVVGTHKEMLLARG